MDGTFFVEKKTCVYGWMAYMNTFYYDYGVYINVNKRKIVAITNTHFAFFFAK